MASNVKTKPWYRRVLGPDLIQCNTVNDSEMKFVSTDSVLKHYDCKLEILGLYFTPIIAMDECNLTMKLMDLYKQVNEQGSNEDISPCDGMNSVPKKKFEVVQIVLQTNVDCVINMTDVEENFKKLVKDVPWFAIPYRDLQRKARLWRRFRARTAAPTLVLVEARSGRVVTSGGCERLDSDPGGARFPWRPRPVLAALAAGPLLAAPALRPPPPAPADPLAAADVIGLYFSAHWCPPCKAFTPQLVDTYARVRERGLRFEVVFVSSDRSEQSFRQYAESMPWLAVPYADDARRRELAALFSVQGIPSLVLLDRAGRLISMDGRGDVNEDPYGHNFPWYPKLVNILTERYAAKLHDHPAIILFVEGDQGEEEFAESVLLPAAEEYRLHYQPSEDEDYLHFFIGCDCDTSDLLREFIGIDDAVPLLTAVDIPSGHVSIMEDSEEITEESVKNFVAKFLEGSLNTTDIVSNDLQMNLSSVSVI